MIYTLLGIAKLNAINPQLCLRHVLDSIAEHPINRIDELLPWALATRLSDTHQEMKLTAWRPGAHGQNRLMRIKLIEELPMASSFELYQLSWVIEQLLADPRRIVQARGQLHTGQQVQYLNWNDGKLRAARVVAMKDRRVTVLDEASRSHLTMPYAAIVRLEPSGTLSSAEEKDPSPRGPPPEIASRSDFRVGQRVSFTDQHLQRRVGLIVRINQRTATLDCDGQSWRVAYGLLHQLVDV